MFARQGASLATREGRDAFDTEAAALIRAGDYKRANAFFLAALRAAGGHYYRLCHAIADRYVGLEGWDDLFADFELHARRGLRITALGIHLSGHGDGPEPALQTGYYTGPRFDGGDAKLQALLEPHHHGEGLAFAALATRPLMLSGLSSIYRALRASPSLHWNAFDRASPPADFAGVTAAKWYVAFRIHHAIKRDLDKHGLPKSIPVLVGAGDFGVSFGAVYRAERGSPRQREVAKILERRAKTAARDHARHTDEFVRQFRQRRADVRGWRTDHNPDERQTYIGFVEANEKLILDTLGLSTVRPTWKMEDPEFAAFLEKLRANRAARRAHRS